MPIVSLQFCRLSTNCPNINEKVDGSSEAMDIDDLTSTFSGLSIDMDGMIVDEMTIPCTSFNEPHCDDTMEVD